MKGKLKPKISHCQETSQVLLCQNQQKPRKWHFTHTAFLKMDPSWVSHVQNIHEALGSCSELERNSKPCLSEKCGGFKGCVGSGEHACLLGHLSPCPGMPRLPGFNSWLQSSLAMWIWVCFLTSFCLNVLISKVRAVIRPTSWDCCED